MPPENENAPSCRLGAHSAISTTTGEHSQSSEPRDPVEVFAEGVLEQYRTASSDEDRAQLREMLARGIAALPRVRRGRSERRVKIVTTITERMLESLRQEAAARGTTLRDLARRALRRELVVSAARRAAKRRIA